MKKELTIEVNTEGLDDAIKKAKRLVELLREAAQIVNSISAK